MTFHRSNIMVIYGNYPLNHLPLRSFIDDLPFQNKFDCFHARSNYQPGFAFWTTDTHVFHRPTICGCSRASFWPVAELAVDLIIPHLGDSVHWHHWSLCCFESLSNSSNLHPQRVRSDLFIVPLFAGQICL